MKGIVMTIWILIQSLSMVGEANGTVLYFSALH